MRYLYKDLLDGVLCCRNCDNKLEVEIQGCVKLFCPEQDSLVLDSGYCEAHKNEFWEK